MLVGHSDVWGVVLYVGKILWTDGPAWVGRVNVFPLSEVKHVWWPGTAGLF